MHLLISLTILATAINLPLSTETEFSTAQATKTKYLEEKNEVPATRNDSNVPTENKQAPEPIEESIEQNNAFDNQGAEVNVTTAGLNQVPWQMPTDMPKANQTDINITEKVKSENENLNYLDVDEETQNIIEEEQPAANDVTETHLPEEDTVPTEQPCSLIWPECTKNNSDQVVEEVARELTAFSLKLFQTLSDKTRTPNLVVAPISIALSLSQLMLGAGGETRNAILKTLYGDVNQIQCVHDAIQNLTKIDSILTANEVFYNKELSLTDDFITQSMRFYGSKGRQLFKDQKQSVDTINNWVSEKTNNLIPELLKKLPSDLQLMLINVIYYQGKWISRFDPHKTKFGKFHLSNSRSVKVKMMNSQKYPLQSIRDSYLNSRVARFPLSNNCSLLIFLPQSQAEEGLNILEKQLTQEILYLLIKQLQEITPYPTVVSIPQLNLDSDIRLNEVLSLLGLYDLFEYPNLCMLSNNTEVAVGDIHHRAVLEVKEEGVKAAIASSISVARTITMYSVQKPFLFILASDISSIPILIGRVNDPSQQKKT